MSDLPRRGVDAHRIRAAAALRGRSRGAAPRHREGARHPPRAASSRPRVERSPTTAARIVKLLGRSLASTFTEVRSHVPTDCSASRDAAGAARRGRRRRLVRWWIVRRPRQGGELLHRAGGRHSRRVVRRPARVAAHRDPHDLLRRRAHAVLRDDRRAHAHEGRGRRTDLRAHRGRVRPAAHARHPRSRERRDRDERDRALRRGRVLAAPHARGRGDRARRASGASPARCLPSWTTPTTSTRAPTLLAGAALAGRSLENATMGVHHGLAQLVGGRTGIPHGLANAVILAHAMRFNADVAPDEMHADRRGARRSGRSAGRGRAPRRAARPAHPACGDCGVDEDDLDAVARMSQSSFAVQANLRPVGETDARAILADAY